MEDGGSWQLGTLSGARPTERRAELVVQPWEGIPGSSPRGSHRGRGLPSCAQGEPCGPMLSAPHSVGEVARLAHSPEACSRPGRRRHTQLDAINKTFIQTTAVQGTIQIKKKKGKGNRKNIFSTLHLHTSFAVLCLHSSIEHGIPWI